MPSRPGLTLKTAAFAIVYCACALAAAVHLSATRGNLSLLLPPHASSPLLPVLLAVPALIGLVLQLGGRRLWTWPYVYLLSLTLVHTASGIDEADRIYLYTSQLAAVLAIALGETIGLSLGRWLNRPAAIGYFCAGGAAQIVYAFSAGDNLIPDWIEQVTFSAGGSLFLVQGVIQLYINRRSITRAATDAAKAGDEPVRGNEPEDPAE